MTAEPDEHTAPPEAIPAVPVAVGHDVNTQPQAADFGGWSSYHLAGTEQPQPILPFDPNRHRAVVIVAQGDTSTVAEGEAATPAAGGTTIAATGILPAGVYTVAGTNMLSGAATAADINNFALLVGATRVGVLPNADNTEILYPFAPVIVVVPAGGAVISTQTAAAPSGTASYWSQFSVMPLGSGGLVYLGTQAQCLTKTGGQVPAGMQVVIENNQQLWMVPDGTSPVVVSVLAERWDSGT